jgi:hypothetical protein
MRGRDVRLPKMGQVKRQNPQGARAETSAPVLVDKPDLRRWNRGQRTVPEDLTPADRIAYASARRRNRPEVTRWRTAIGYVEQTGDTQVYYAPCQRCKRWFSVTRTWSVANAKASWPEYCSDTCRDIVDSTNKRRGARRVRNGETSGRKAKRIQVRSFDPEGPEAWWTAQDIVNEDVTSTPTAYRAAADYLDSLESESLTWDEEESKTL